MRTRKLSVTAILVFGLGACASVTLLDSRVEPLRGRVITEEMIAASGASTAWDVLLQSGAYRMVSDQGGAKAGIHSRRGKTSVLLAYSDVPRLIVDGARISDLSLLHEIPARSIAWIQLLGGIDGGIEEGTNSGGGVIRIVSKVGR